MVTWPDFIVPLQGIPHCGMASLEVACFARGGSLERIPDLSVEEAQREFSELVRSQETTALWYMKQPIPADITGPTAPRILDQIAQRGSREIWLRARRLKRWRAEHFH